MGQAKHTKNVPPVIETSRLRLRPWRDTDAPTTDPDTLGRQFMSGAMPTRAEFPAWLLTRESRMAEGEGFYWCVADRDTDEPLGHLQCFRLNSPMTRGTGWLGYWLHEHARGRGLISDALDLLVGHAFSPVKAGGLDLHRLAALTDLDNAASQRVLRRAGFTECGHEREAMAHDGRPGADAISFELLATDDRATRRAVPALPPVFETPRLRLRPWRDSDAPGDGEGPDADSVRFMPAGAQPGPDDFPEWLAKRRREMDTGVDLHWCLADLTTDEMLGNVQIFRMGRVENRFQGELGYWLRPGARGRGLIGEALGPVIDHAFASADEGGLGLIRLHAATDSDNHASQSILRSAGFTQWGADHQAWRRVDGSLSDGAYFELLASEPLHDPDGHQATTFSPALLDGDRVRLRPWSGDDLTPLNEGLADWMSRPVDESDAKRWLARRRPREEGHLPQQNDQLVSWCIADRSTGDAVGNIDVFDIGRPVLPGGCELGYWTHPDYRGKGLMTEALRRLIPHLLGSTESGGLGLRRVTARTSELNVVSQSVMRAVGMHQWGVAPRASIAPDGTAVGQVHFAVLADELDQAVGGALGVEPITLAGNPPQAGGAPRVRLRQWRHADVERVAEGCSDERTQHWLAGSLPSPYTLEHAHSYIGRCGEQASNGNGVYWCVADAESDVCIGAVSVMDLRDALGTAGEIGYWTHPDARSRGVMSEAVRLAVRHAFVASEDGGLGRKRLRLNAADGNLASQHIARANGFVEVGRDRQAEPLGDGTFADVVRFDLLVDEWNAAG